MGWHSPLWYSGCLGCGPVLVPIEGASQALGVITVKSYKRLVQHLEGGIVKEIRVRNGDSVAAGDVLLVIDNTQSLAQLERNRAQLDRAAGPGSPLNGRAGRAGRSGLPSSHA